MASSKRHSASAVLFTSILSSSGAWGGSQIINGVPATIEEAPYHVLFDMSGDCGASWIGGRWVLTAAHCVEDDRQNGYVHAGITKVSEKSDATRIPIKRYIVHPEYKTRDKDIALLELSRDITTPKARPIALVSPADASAGLTATGRAARLTGWGLDANEKFPDNLYKLDAKIGSNDNQSWVLTFAGAVGGKLQGSCSGDSGGPLVVKDATGTFWLQAGVVNSGTGECGENPGFYARVSSFYSWIQENTGKVTALAGAGAGQPTILSVEGGRFQLIRPRTLEVTVLDLAGAAVGRSAGRYSEGYHALPTAGLAHGNYILRFVGDGLRIDWPLRVGP